jgi:hypothetical protein
MFISLFYYVIIYNIITKMLYKMNLHKHIIIICKIMLIYL